MGSNSQGWLLFMTLAVVLGMVGYTCNRLSQPESAPAQPAGSSE